MRDEEPAGLGINGVIPGDGECVMPECQGSSGDGLMCRRHWSVVPRGLRDNLRYVMSEWGRNRGTLADVRDAQWACVDAITDDGEVG